MLIFLAMFSKVKLSVIAPMFNEEMGIELFLNEILLVLEAHFEDYELLLIDDGSTDGTYSKCLPYIRNNSSVRLIGFSRNYGHEIASSAGFDYASGDYVVLMDSDLQHPPSLIPSMMSCALQEKYDIVCAARSNRRHESWIQSKTAALFYLFAQNMTGFKLEGDIGNFRLMSRKTVNSLKQMKESSRHLVMMFAYIGYSTKTISYECSPWYAGRSKYSIKRKISLALDSVVSFSSRPLHLMSILSIFISFVMMSYAGFILIQKLFAHQQLVDGMASIIFLIAGLFSVLFLFLAVISEYISRILVESKNRPLYYVKTDTSEQVEINA